LLEHYLKKNKLTEPIYKTIHETTAS